MVVVGAPANDDGFGALFARDKPVIFAFHGYHHSVRAAGLSSGIRWLLLRYAEGLIHERH